MPSKELALSFLIVVFVVVNSSAQQESDVTRVEFNSGTRTQRQQVILTPDSIRIIREDFRVDQTPDVTDRAMPSNEWQNVISSLKDVRLTEIKNLQSPSMRRTFDGAAHGSLIITTRNGDTYTHGFDDEQPHRKLRGLMNAIQRIRGK